MYIEKLGKKKIGWSQNKAGEYKYGLTTLLATIEKVWWVKAVGAEEDHGFFIIVRIFLNTRASPSAIM